MNEYFKEFQGLILFWTAVGVALGIILPLVFSRVKSLVASVFQFVGDSLAWAFSKSYFVWVFGAFQIGLEVFLLQQWIFGWNLVNYPGGIYDEYCYIPLTVSIPGFVFNFFAFWATVGRLAELDKK